jgi:hypothetical protein
MLKINSSTIITKKCICCNNLINIKVYANPSHREYRQPITGYKSRLTCSRACHKLWQKSISWEERIGSTRAAEIRKIRSEQLSINNPSTNPEVAKKISNSLKKFLKENPEKRQGVNNSFFGRKHKKETIDHWKTVKAGKWSYTLCQKERQKQNTPKKENHPNWLGGIANGEYGHEFNQSLKFDIKALYNFTCQLCEITQVELDVHHIDYNKKNNNVKNLVPLCKVCHGKTNYNREKWQKIFEEKLTDK